MSTYPIPLTDANHVQLWADETTIEPQALQQLRDIATLPEVTGLRVMPDVHYGKGATVGSVIAMRSALAPAAVGVDLGCGVCAVRTNLHERDLTDLPGLRASIEDRIPVGFNAHTDTDLIGLNSNNRGIMRDFASLTVHDDLADRETRTAQQLGTLGGGNHFIELCADEEGTVWLTLHSGSRGIGKQIADRHITTAKGLEHNATYGDMAIFRGGTQEMDAYLHDLNWAQAYAAASRATMMWLFKMAVIEHFTGHGLTVEYGTDINVHHNYVATETIDGEELIITRKGAIRAGAGELALIPGSMGTGSYIVKGLGNPASYYSASHGAGRRMSRTQAKAKYTVKDLAAQTAGIECRKDNGVIDEIPTAYKDINQVITDQDNLITPIARLRTLLCVKG